MAAHIPAATGSMTVIACNWNSNWIADIRRGSNLAFLYNSITKLSHHFRTQTNKVERQKKKKNAYRNLDAATPRKKKKKKKRSPPEKLGPHKNGQFQVRVWVCVINTGVSRAQVKFSRGQCGLNANLANGGIMGAEVGVSSQMSKWLCPPAGWGGTVKKGIKGWNGGLSVRVCRVQCLCVHVHNTPRLWYHF